VQVVKRVSAEKVLWFVLNTGSETFSAELDAGQELREILLEENGLTTLQTQDGRYVRTIYPFESLMLEACEAAEPIEPLPRISVSLRGPARLHLWNKNVLRLYEWRMSLLGQDGTPEQTAVVPAVPLSDQLAKGSFKFVPVLKAYFGHAPELAWPRLRVVYECTFENRYAGPVELVMEPGSIVGDWRMRVNESAPFGLQDFSPTDAHVRGSLGKDITALLSQGTNTILTEVETDKPDGGLLNALYLAGGFGVELRPVRLVERPDLSAFEQYMDNRLPFYDGVVEYAMEFALEHVPAGPRVVVQFETDTPFHEATEVSINGSGWQAVLWQPRCIVLRAEQLRPGKNDLQVRVYTTRVRSFEGQWFDDPTHEYRAIV